VHGDRSNCKVIGRRIEEIPLPEGTRIGCVVRGEQVLMAHHDTTIEPDDHVVIFIPDRRHVDQVEKLFMGEATR
jgi:trk system potassium uptake protein